MKEQLLIEELTPQECNIICEERTDDGKSLWLSGVFMQAEMKNRNGRNYPLSEISAAVDNAQKIIKEHNGIMGELDHPQTLSVNLDRVSHIITDLRMEGNNAIGKAKLLNTPTGKIAKELIEAGVSLGVSSRGAGSVNESGGVTGFNFVTVDIVATPSAPGAIPNTIYESLDRAKNGKVIMDLSEAVIHDEAAQEYFKKEFIKFLNTNFFMKK